MVPAPASEPMHVPKMDMKARRPWSSSELRHKLGHGSDVRVIKDLGSTRPQIE